MLDEIEERRLRPVQVVENEDERPFASERLEQPPDGKKGVLTREGCLLDEPDRRRNGVEHPPAFEVTVEQACELVIRRERLEDLDEREVGDSFAVRQAASPQNDRVLVLGEKLVNESRLADPSRPEQREQVARLVSYCTGVGLPQLRQLVVSTDERRIEAAGERGCIRSNSKEAICEYGVGLSFCLDRLDRLEFERAFGEVVSARPDEDLSRLRGLLEPRGDVDGVTRRKRATLARHDLAGVDAHPDPQLGPEVALKVFIQAAELLAQLVRGPGCPQRIVLVDDGDSEDGHDRITDELLHGATVAFQHVAREREVPLHHSAELLRVESLAQCGRAGHVAEEDRYGLADLAWRRSFHQLRATGTTEPEPRWVLGTTTRTNRHTSERNWQDGFACRADPDR